MQRNAPFLAEQQLACAPIAPRSTTYTHTDTDRQSLIRRYGVEVKRSKVKITRPLNAVTDNAYHIISPYHL